MAKSKPRKKKIETVEDDMPPRIKQSTRIAAFVAIVVVFALVAGMVALGSAVQAY